MKITVRETRTFLQPVHLRQPFRFGAVTVREAEQMVVRAEIEGAAGRAHGWAADILAPKWFDKTPGRDLETSRRLLLEAVDIAAARYRAAPQDTAFDIWRAALPDIEAAVLKAGFNRLGAAFASSLFERAVLDALGRITDSALHALLGSPLPGIRLEALHPELAGLDGTAALAPAPADRVAVRHTVGMADPLGDCQDGAALNDAPADGLPVTLRDYMERDGVDHLKIKVAGDGEETRERLQRISRLMDALPQRTWLATLDGNEQFRAPEEVESLLAWMAGSLSVRTLYRALSFVEQPLDRAATFRPECAAGLRRAGRLKPIVIDEADDHPGAFREALALGYRGVSHKNCKGIYKSLANAALAKRRGDGAFLTAEDLTTLPVVALQADLAMVAALGLGHVERNGHHYVSGLDHLSPDERSAALGRHGDLYRRTPRGAELAVRNGEIRLGSVNAAPGFGFAVPPDVAHLAERDPTDHPCAEVSP